MKTVITAAIVGALVVGGLTAFRVHHAGPSATSPSPAGTWTPPPFKVIIENAPTPFPAPS